MPRKTVYTAEIEFLQLLDEHGRLDEALAHDGGPLLSDAEVKSLYELMVINRQYDDRAMSLQRSGRMGTFPQNLGQEAAALGAAKAIRKGHDWLVPYYRENPASFLNGLPMHFIYLFWMGDERGNQIPENLAQSPICVEIGAQVLHAAGIAWSFKLRKQDKTVLAFMGDGATSTGDFHEGMNFASVYKLPIVFSCLNNGWAISVPTCGQTGSQTFAQKGLAYGMPSMQVDGNDIFAVYRAHKLAIERARNGEGPQFIEQLTYRLGDHTTADDARRYRSADELAAWQRKDPLIRTCKYLESKGLWDDKQQHAIDQRAKTIVQEVTRTSLEFPSPAREDMFDYVYSKLTPELARQRATNRTDSIGQDPEQIGLKASEHHV